MATQKKTIEFILHKLGHAPRFVARAMFGEYALYADGKVVALVCNDQLFVKIMPESATLEEVCEKAPPYPGAKPHYVIEKSMLSMYPELPEMLFAIASALPDKKQKKRSK